MKNDEIFRPNPNETKLARKILGASMRIEWPQGWTVFNWRNEIVWTTNCSLLVLELNYPNQAMRIYSRVSFALDAPTSRLTPIHHCVNGHLSESWVCIVHWKVRDRKIEIKINSAETCRENEKTSRWIDYYYYLNQSRHTTFIYCNFQSSCN